MNPELTTDQLLELIDGIVEKPDWISKPYVPTSPTITYRDNTTNPPYTVTCSNN